ncbi:MAG: hypothetical protein ACI9TY_001609, partial [Alphaproteobacteria bacterium]
YFTFGRLTISTLILIMPFAYDHFVPEVAGDIRWYMMHFAGLALVSTFFVYLYSLSKKGEKFNFNFKFTITSWAVIVAVLFALLTCSWGMSLPNNWWFLKNFLGYALIFSFALHLRHEEWYKNLMWLLAIGVCFNAGLGILQYFAVTDAQILAFFSVIQVQIKEYVPFFDNFMFINFFQQSAPPAGAFANKNLAASYMVMCLPLMAYLITISNSRIKLALASLSFTLAGIFVVYTRSRGSWISALAVLIFTILWLALNKGDRNALIQQFNLRKTIALLTSILIILVASSFNSKLNNGARSYHSMGSSVSSHFSTISNISEKELSVRAAYNLNGIDILLDNPMGVGLGAFHTIYPKYFKSSIVTPKQGYNLGARPRRMHNDMFQAFVELGVVGGMAHLLIFLSPLWMAWRISRQEKTSANTKILSFFTLLAIAGISVNSLGDFPLQMPSAPSVLWLLVGIMTGLYVLNVKGVHVGWNFKTHVPKKITLALLFIVSIIPLYFVTYDNYMRREGTLYLKPALGLSRSGQNNDTTLYFINKSNSFYTLNPRVREITGVIYMSHKTNGKDSKAKLSYEQRLKALTDALRYDPYAQNTLINIAMLNIREAQEALNMGDKKYATQLIKSAHEYSKKAVPLAHYAPNAHTVHGITLLYLNQTQAAYNHFKQAITINPQFVPAQQYIQKLQPMVKSGAIKG